jgi:hypothetical protein
MRRYTDAELVDAVAGSRSWRGVLRAVGLSATSAAAMRSVRRQADRLGLDYGHFTGQRRWTDEQLAAAIAAATTWTQVAEVLGLSGGTSTATIRGHATRLGLDTTHLARVRPVPLARGAMRPLSANLGRGGALMAAGWFELCGRSVSWPLEPCPYDLLVWTGDAAERIQVKTTTTRSGRSWTVWLSRTGKRRTPYDPDEIDQFFVIDGELEYYLIPVSVVGGLMRVQLSAYQDFRLLRDLSY